MTRTNTTATDFSYDVGSDEAAEEFFSLMARANVQPERIAAMRETRERFLAYPCGCDATESCSECV